MEDTDIALKKIVKGAGIFSIGLIASKALAYVYRIIIARIGVEQYGLLSITLAVFGIFTTISLLGMNDGVVRFVSFYKGKSDQRRIKGIITSALKITLPLSLVCIIFLFFASDWVAITFFHNKNLSALFKILSFGIPLDVLRSIFFSTMKAFQKVEYEVYAKSITENATKVILTLVAVWLGFSIMWVAVAYLFSIFVSFVLSFYFLEKKVFPIIFTKIVSIRSDKPLFSYSLPLLFTGFVFLIIQWTDTIMLGNLRTVSEVGLYNVALPTAALLYLIPVAIRNLFLPVLSELYAQNKMSVFKSVYQKVVKWVIIVDSIIFVFLVVFSHQIIRILFGEAYVQEKTVVFGMCVPLSVLTLIILAFCILIAEILSSPRDILLVLKKTKLIFLNVSIGTVLNVILNYIWIPKYGMIGAGSATGLAFITIFMLMWLETYYITSVNPFKISYLKIGFSAGLILFLMLILKLYLVYNIFYLIVTGLISFVIYLFLLLLTKSFDKDDVMILSSMQKKLGLKFDLEKILRKFI